MDTVAIPVLNRPVDTTITGLKVPGIVIKDPGCTAKTFPDYFTRFFQMLEQ